MKQTGTKSTNLWKQFVALGALSALAAVLVVSCSDDNPTNSTKITGNSSDSSFQLVSNQLSPSNTDPVGLNWIDSMITFLPGYTPVSPGGNVPRSLARTSVPGVEPIVIVNSLTVDTASGWITFDATIVEGTDSFTVVDSLRFRDLSNNPVIPTGPLDIDSLNGLDIRVHGRATVTDPNDFTGTAAVHGSLTVDVIGRDAVGTLDTIRISGSQADSLVGVVNDSLNGQCDITVTQTVTLTNIVGLVDDTTSECPISGSARITATVDADCSAGQGTLVFNDTWTVTATFNGGTSATIVFENATTRWEVTEPCGDNPQPAVSSFGRLKNLAKASMQ